ncbi:MAG: response regulator transcription factor [Bacteroidetes bacterium]|nr:response regulator transcription factor [Bacteroidota bacterium]
MLNIAIAEDQTLFRKGIISLLNSFNNTTVCIEAENGEDMLNQLSVSSSPIHVALIDINMPHMNGIELMKNIRKLYPAVKNIILTIHEEEKYIHKLIEEGANAYLVKNADPSEVEKAIHTVVTHDYYFNEKIIGVMHNHMQKKKNKNLRQPDIEITSREKDVLQLICKELTSQEISKKLFITESTVNGHRNNLLLKIGCRNTAGLVLYALKNEIVDIG